MNDIPNNKVIISGEITKEFEYSHEVYGEKFYVTDVAIKRLSGVEDIIPVIVSEQLAKVGEKWTGKCVEIHGQLRSYNKREESKTTLILEVFARTFETLEERKDINEISIDGYICKQPTFRETPLGREIADMIVAVNRPYGKSDYIPCIAWGRNAVRAYEMAVGSHIRIKGRLQSRIYVKKLDDEKSEERTAYELSIARLEELSDENND